MRVKLEFRVSADAPVRQMVEYIQALEGAGVDGVGIPEHPEGGRDQFVALTAALVQTRRITLWPAISTPFTRHPAILAGMAESLEEMAPGRTRLGLGSGDSSSTYLGIHAHTVGEMRGIVRTIKLLLRGEEVTFGGDEDVTFKFQARVGDQPPPVFVAASGPKTIEMAAGEADGVVVRTGLHPKMVEKARSHVRQGAIRAGRDPDQVKVIFTAFPLIMEDTDEEARNRARRHCFSWMQRDFQRLWLEEIGMELPKLDSPEAIPESLLAEMCDAIGIIGSPRHCLEVISRTADVCGVDHLFCMTYGPDNMSRKVLDGLHRMVMPGLKGL
ncbi:MAG: LLM class flavin-dependent oxidoreductase [Chloroflexi bacterium]|nr:LLM class flavin-dependent oxidoreductase [Chloroflexota bacterium]